MIKLLGIPYDLNSSFLRGPAYAPDRIRLMDSEGSANRFTELGSEIIPGKTYEDLGNVEFKETDPKSAFEQIRRSVGAALSDGSKLVSLGGDHSIAYPIISAYVEKFPGLHILQIDAHGDLYENFENNPYSHASPFARIMESSAVDSLTQVGIRTLTTHQEEQAEKYSVNVIQMKDHSLDFLKELRGPLYVSLDLDGLDPVYAPGVSHHEPGGLSTRQVLDIIHGIDVEIVGADVVEYNPIRDHQNMTAMVAYKMMKEIMGKM